MKRPHVSGMVALAACIMLAGCGGYTAPNQGNSSSGLKFRAYVSQSVSSATLAAGLDLVDASLDRLVRAPGVTVGTSPTIMQVSANKTRTLAFDSLANAVYVVDNSTETTTGHVTLPSFSESMAISTDGTIGFAAVPNAPVLGQVSGSVEVLNVSRTVLSDPIPIPGAHFVVLSPDNTKLFVLSDSTNTVTLVTLTNTGTTNSPNWVVGQSLPLTSGFDRPVWAVFSTDSSTAFVLNCGPECGGAASTVVPINLTTPSSPAVGSPIPVPAATKGVIFGQNLYVAGTATTSPNNSCTGANTAAIACGRLTVIDTNALQVTTPNPIVITDGNHVQMAVTSDNQVYVGAQHCSEVRTQNEQRGCLSIYNPALNKVIVGTDHGDVTGIAPVTGRNQVYVIENGELRIWSTATNTLLPDNKQVDISGQAEDVVLVD